MSAHSGLGPLTTVGDARLLAGITAAMPTLHYADHLAVLAQNHFFQRLVARALAVMDFVAAQRRPGSDVTAEHPTEGFF